MEDNHPLTADAIGNPTNYRGLTMQWEGRRLTQINATGNAPAASFQYDADGLRTKKTQSNGTVSNYYYVNGRLAYEKRGDKELYYVYDQLGNLFYIRYVYGASDLNYYVATNSRGDVETIYSGTGTVKTWWPWGHLLDKSIWGSYK